MRAQETIAFFVIFVIVAIVIYFAIFQPVGSVKDYPTPAGAGQTCQYQSDCQTGQYCTSLVKNGQVITGTCSPWCMTAAQLQYNKPPGVIAKDSCSTFYSPSATCDTDWNPQTNPNGDPYSYYCQPAVCSATNYTCQQGEVCVPASSDLSTGLCYPDPSQPDPQGLPSRALCDPTNSNNGGNCYGNPNIPCQAGTYNGQPANVCVPKNVIEKA